MKKMTLFVCALATMFAAGAYAADEEGWVSLFNGKDLDGWEQLNGKAKYTVEDGAIVGTSVPNSPNSFLCTKMDYGDFILEFEFKAHPSMNSGVQFRSQSLEKYKNGRVHGYQCELEDEGQDRDWFGGIYDEARRGWLYPTKKDDEESKALAAKFSAQGKTVWKNGEWNTIRIEAVGNSIKTYVNGELRADLKDDMTPEGFIGLQVHGVGGRKEPMSVRWRNIRIKELKKAE